MLTLITIAYLPLSYVMVRLRNLMKTDLSESQRLILLQSLFSVSEWALPRHEGLSIYVKYLFIFLIMTFITAFSLDLVLRKAPKVKEIFRTLFTESSPPTDKELGSGPQKTATGLSAFEEV